MRRRDVLLVRPMRGRVSIYRNQAVHLTTTVGGLPNR
jgi:hypothetical protein